jgi:hypothetical protein
MKTLLAVALAFLFAAAESRATTTDVWIADSPTAFDVTISGTGEITTDGSGTFVFGNNPGFTSPSGLWRFLGGTTFLWGVPFLPAGTWEVTGGSETAIFVPSGTVFNMIAYLDLLANTLPVQDVNGRFSVFGNDSAQFTWLLLATFTITSEPDPNDPTTWTWENHFVGHGDSLAVPESGGAVGLLAIGICGLAMLHRMNKSLRA